MRMDHDVDGGTCSVLRIQDCSLHVRGAVRLLCLLSKFQSASECSVEYYAATQKLDHSSTI